MIVWGVICIILALTSMQTVAWSEYGYAAVGFWALLGSVLIARGIHRNKQRQTQTQQQTVIVNNYTTPAQPKPSGMTVRATSGADIGSDCFSVAGVTFQNEDGSSRQDILRAICAGKSRGQSDVELEQYDYKGSAAIRILTPEGCVGNVRRTDVADVLEMMSGSYEAYIEVNSFVGEEGREIYRADLYVDAE